MEVSFVRVPASAFSLISFQIELMKRCNATMTVTGNYSVENIAWFYKPYGKQNNVRHSINQYYGPDGTINSRSQRNKKKIACFSSHRYDTNGGSRFPLNYILHIHHH